MARREHLELNEAAVDRITRVVRSLTEDRVERGIELARPMHCDSCGLEKPSAGSALSGAYKLCNDCLLDFTLALAAQRVQNVAEFMTRKYDDTLGTPPSEFSGHRDRQSVQFNTFGGREKLQPRNEPC